MTLTPAALTDLCTRALPEERLTVDELTHVCFGPGDEIIGDDDGAIAFTFKEYGKHRSVWLVLVAVPPERQGAGVGTALVHAALDVARRAIPHRAPRERRPPATSGPAST